MVKMVKMVWTHEQDSSIKEERENVLSLQRARNRVWQQRGGSNAPVGLAANQRPLERLEAENAELRSSVVELVLQIQALRDGAR
jgi:hypothetical protein